jgi:hypothetical protein
VLIGLLRRLLAKTAAVNAVPTRTAAPAARKPRRRKS